MNICIDIQAAIAQRAGVGRYTKLLVEHLAPLRAGDDLQLFYFDFKRKGEPFPVEGAAHKAVHWVPGRIVQKAWKTVGWPPFDAFAGRADLYHFPNFVRPPLRRGRSVVTIHDLSFLRFPETMEPGNLEFLSRHIRRTVEQCDAIITDCATIADELREHMNVPEEKLFPVHLGLHAIAAPPAGEVEAFRNRHGLDRPYLLHVGTLEPRKNHRFLVDLFDALDFDGDLVLAGMKGWKVDPILERIAASPKAKRIRHLDFVADADLPALYAGAELFLFPSLYEGFGFPPLEAMACGTPVLASDAGSLGEVLGDGADVLHGYDLDQWQERAHTLIEGGEARSALIERGYAKAASYSWERCAAETWKVYRQL